MRGIELCVGAGGLALAVARSGIQNLTVLDCNAIACATLNKNKALKTPFVKDWTVLQSDVATFQFDSSEEIDLLSGGPPCQPFSQGGSKQGRSDRRDMFPHFIRAVRDLKPRAFLIENVRGLRSAKSLRYFNYLVLQLRFPFVPKRPGEKWTTHRARLEDVVTAGAHGELEYNVIFETLNAADFGVAQKRDRLFIVGIRSDQNIAYHFPLPTHSRISLLKSMWHSKVYWERHNISVRRRPANPYTVEQMEASLTIEGNAPWLTVRDAIAGLPNVGPGRKSHKVHNHFFNPGARSYAGHDGSSLDWVAKTIKAGSHGVPGGENMVRLGEESVRYFTVRECARLQSFPDEWRFDGSWCSAMHQVGNAVPVKLGEAVAQPLINALRKVTVQDRPC